MENTKIIITSAKLDLLEYSALLSVRIYGDKYWGKVRCHIL
jgi:hypothetical protein